MSAIKRKLVRNRKLRRLSHALTEPRQTSSHVKIVSDNVSTEKNDRGVAKSQNAGWTTGRTSKGGLEVEPPAGSRSHWSGQAVKLLETESGACTSTANYPRSWYAKENLHPPPPRKKTHRICVSSRSTLCPPPGDAAGNERHPYHNNDCNISNYESVRRKRN